MDWIKDKFWGLNDIFEKYPKVFWITMLYLSLAAMATIGYVPLLEGLANLNIMGMYPFYPMIADNIDLLRWGILVIPTVILLYGWSDAEDLYYKLNSKRYRH